MRGSVEQQVTVDATPHSGGRNALPWAIRGLLGLAGPRPQGQPATARRIGWKPILAAAGVGVLVIAAFFGGRRWAPAKVRTVVRTQQVPVLTPVPDEAAQARLRKELAGLTTERDAAIRRAELAEAALAEVRGELDRLQQELAAARTQIQRLSEALDAASSRGPRISNANAACTRCGHLMTIRAAMIHERVRCPNARCGLIMSARAAMQHRAAQVERLNGRK
jgi:hypothetical protein